MLLVKIFKTGLIPGLVAVCALFVLCSRSSSEDWSVGLSTPVASFLACPPLLYAL